MRAGCALILLALCLFGCSNWTLPQPAPICAFCVPSRMQDPAGRGYRYALWHNAILIVKVKPQLWLCEEQTVGNSEVVTPPVGCIQVPSTFYCERGNGRWVDWHLDDVNAVYHVWEWHAAHGLGCRWPIEARIRGNDTG